MLRRLFVLAIAFSLFLLPVSAAQYADAYSLFENWEVNGYPDDVGGVYSYDGDGTHLMILLVNGTDARREELRALLENDTALRFGDAAISYQELVRICDDLSHGRMQDPNSGILGCGIELLGEENKAFYVVVETDNAHVDSLSGECTQKYGAAVRVSAESSDIRTDTAEHVPGGAFLLLALLCAVFLCMVLFRRRISAWLHKSD